MKPTDDLQNHMGGIDRGSLEEGVSCIHGSSGFDELSVQHCPADSRRQDEFERRGQGKEQPLLTPGQEVTTRDKR